MTIKLVSKSRWRATASQKRMYGGSTVTEFYVRINDVLQDYTVIGFGLTPGSRKTYAKTKVEHKLGLKQCVNSQDLINADKELRTLGY